MYNIDNEGIKTPTLSNILEYLENSMKSIYGENIDLSQNTPDGQWINKILLWFTNKTI